MSEYDKLLEELDLLQKAYGDEDGDQKIAAAAEDDDDEDHDEPDADNAGGPSDGDEDNEDDDGFEPIAKSFAFQLDTGETVEAVDATGMLKSLQGKLASTETLLAKAIGENETMAGKVLDLLKSQNTEIASLRQRVARLSGEGRGRKAVLNVHESAEPMAKSQPDAARDLMAKAQAAFSEGKISGREWNELDASLRMGQTPNPSLIAKALA